MQFLMQSNSDKYSTNLFDMSRVMLLNYSQSLIKENFHPILCCRAHIFCDDIERFIVEELIVLVK